ncbi:MAG: C25 family cysteine peptidase, partial [candidate division WOR-3 bacterium]
MRRIVMLVMAVVLPVVAGVVVRTARFDPSDLVITRDNGYDNIALPRGVTLIQPGAPAVPRVVEAIAIPAGAVPVGMELLEVEWTTLPGTYRIGPAQPDFPLPRAGEKLEVKLWPPDPVIYSSAEPYPSSVAFLSGFGAMAGYRIAHVELHPVRYIPRTGQVQLATRIGYRLEYVEGGAGVAVATKRQQELFGDMVRLLVVNPEDVSRFAPRVSRANSLVLPPGDYEYVVITEAPMDTVFQRLADWKTLKGVPGTVVRVSWINGQYPGYDLQEKIRNFIKDAYETWGTSYVLLGGQGDYQTSGQNIIPTRMANYSNNGDEPCDLYYAGLDGSWDANGNHVYGEIPDSADMYSDVFVGRAPVYNVVTAQNFVNK